MYSIQICPFFKKNNLYYRVGNPGLKIKVLVGITQEILSENVEGVVLIFTWKNILKREWESLEFRSCTDLATGIFKVSPSNAVKWISSLPSPRRQIKEALYLKLVAVSVYFLFLFFCQSYKVSFFAVWKQSFFVWWSGFKFSS